MHGYIYNAFPIILHVLCMLAFMTDCMLDLNSPRGGRLRLDLERCEAPLVEKGFVKHLLDIMSFLLDMLVVGLLFVRVDCLFL